MFSFLQKLLTIIIPVGIENAVYMAASYSDDCLNQVNVGILVSMCMC